MRARHATLVIGVVILAVAWVAVDSPRAPWREQSLPAAPASRPDTTRADREVVTRGPNLAAAPASPADAPRVDLEALKRSQNLLPAPASPANAPRVNLEDVEQLDMHPVTDPTSRRLEKETERVTQMAIEAIPLERGSGAAILPFPGADGRPMPIGGP